MYPRLLLGLTSPIEFWSRARCHQSGLNSLATLVDPRVDRGRTVTNPNLTLSGPPEDSKIGGAATPLAQQTSQGSTLSHNQPSSRRGSPHSLLETTRSVPATPLGFSRNGSHLLKTPGTPHTPEIQIMNGLIATPNSHQLTDSSVNAGDLQASLSRLPTGPYDSSLTFNSIQPTGREDVCIFFSSYTLSVC
jgi:hypothetical protein